MTSARWSFGSMHVASGTSIYSQCNSVFRSVYIAILTGSDIHAASVIGYQNLLQSSIHEAYSESKYRFAVKKNRVRFRIKFYCYQILHSSNYFSTYSPPLLRHLS